MDIEPGRMYNLGTTVAHMEHTVLSIINDHPPLLHLLGVDLFVV
jgi:hypothetical protein